MENLVPVAQADASQRSDLPKPTLLCLFAEIQRKAALVKAPSEDSLRGWSFRLSVI